MLQIRANQAPRIHYAVVNRVVYENLCYDKIQYPEYHQVYFIFSNTDNWPHERCFHSLDSLGNSKLITSDKTKKLASSPVPMTYRII